MKAKTYAGAVAHAKARKQQGWITRTKKEPGSWVWSAVKQAYEQISQGE